MGPLLYLMLAYAVFWILSFVFIFTIFNRQRKLNDELTMLRQLTDRQQED